MLRECLLLLLVLPLCCYGGELLVTVNDLGFLKRDGLLLSEAETVRIDNDGELEERAAGSEGPCRLLWPLNGTEAFVHSFPVPALQRLEKLVIMCSKSVVDSNSVVVVNDEQRFSTIGPLLASGKPVELRYLATYHDGQPATILHVIICSSPTTPTASCVRLDPVWQSVVRGDCGAHQEEETTKESCPWPKHRPGPSIHPMSAMIDTRDDLGVALPLLVPGARTLVEVGVQEGNFGELLLATAPQTLRHYVGVDPWAPQLHAANYIDEANKGHEAHEANMQATVQRLSPFLSEDRAVSLLRLPSLTAAALFRNESLDVVYLDARHDYYSVLRDLAAWWPKLRSGGLLAGHDYVTGLIEGTLFGVRASADKFARDNGLLLLCTRDAYPTFLLFKP